MVDHLEGKMVDEVVGSVQHLNPAAGGKKSLEEEATRHISAGANHVLGPTVPREVRGHNICSCMP
jgi:hypothetical protein